MNPLDNPRGDLVITMTYVVGVILAVAVALRFLARWRSKAGFAADDWWIVGSLIPSNGMLISGAISKYPMWQCMIVSETEIRSHSGQDGRGWKAHPYADRERSDSLDESTMPLRFANATRAIG